MGRCLSLQWLKHSKHNGFILFQAPEPYVTVEVFFVLECLIKFLQHKEIGEGGLCCCFRDSIAQATSRPKTECLNSLGYGSIDPFYMSSCPTLYMQGRCE
jgi:hypothetical protein